MLVHFNDFLQTIARRPFYAVGFLWFITILVFSQVLTADYVAYDEQTDILGNPVINAPLNLASLKRIFFSYARNANQYTPLSTASFWLEQNLFGFNSAISHFISLLLHLGCATLVYFLAISLTGSSLGGWLISMLWAVHPLQVDTVAWVLERRNLLYALPLFASLTLYCAYCETGKGKFRHLALLLMIVSGLAKTLAFFIPFAWLIIDYIKGRQLNSQSIKEKIPALFFAIIFLILMFAGAWGGISQRSSGPLDWSLATYGISFYVGKTILPTSLSPVFEANFAAENSISYGPIFFIMVMSIFIIAGRCNKLAAAGLVFFLCHILPLSGLIRVGQRFFAASHFMYVPLLGLLLAIAACARLVAQKAGMTKFLPALACLLILVFSVLSFSHCAVWQNTETLYEHVLRIDPDCGFARNNLAAFYHEMKDNVRAISHYSELVSRYPQTFSYRQSFAGILLSEARYSAAAEQYQELTSRFPERSEGFSGLATAFYLLGRYEQSLSASDQAIALNSGSGMLHYNRGLTRLAAGDPVGAEIDFSSAITINASDSRALLVRSEVRRSRGNYAGAINDVVTLISLHPGNLIARVKLFELLCESCSCGPALVFAAGLLADIRNADEVRLIALFDVYGNALLDFLLRLFPFRGLINFAVN